MPRLNKAQVLKYLKTHGTHKEQQGDWTSFYLAGCSGRTDFWLKDLPHIRFCQVKFNGGYDWEAHNSNNNKVSYVCTVGVFDIIEAHQNGKSVDEAYEAAAQKTYDGYVDYIRPGAPNDY